MRAVRFHEYGDLDVLRLNEVADPVPGDDEALLQVEACGLNRFDLDLRAGTSRVPLSLPHISGLEIVGRNVSLANGDVHLRVRQRVLVDCELADTILDLTDGRGVDLVFEHVGGDLFGDSLRALRGDGRLVTCGGHGGEVVPLDRSSRWSTKGSCSRS